MWTCPKSTFRCARRWQRRCRAMDVIVLKIQQPRRRATAVRGTVTYLSAIATIQGGQYVKGGRCRAFAGAIRKRPVHGGSCWLPILVDSPASPAGGTPSWGWPLVGLHQRRPSGLWAQAWCDRSACRSVTVEMLSYKGLASDSALRVVPFRSAAVLVSLRNIGG